MTKCVLWNITYLRGSDEPRMSYNCMEDSKTAVFLNKKVSALEEKGDYWR